MIRKFESFGREIVFNLEYKKVKNINLRVKPDGTVFVSANCRVRANVIDAFVASKADFIFRAIEKQKEKIPLKPYYTEDGVKDEIIRICREVYPYFEGRGVKHPEIKFRKMVSRWGSCNVRRCVLTFNINLMYAPKRCIEYVVLHEFTHFLQANHSDRFYAELIKVCPGFKELRQELRKIKIERV